MTLWQAWQALNWQSALILALLGFSASVLIATLLQPKKRRGRHENYYDWRKDAGTGW